VVLVECWAPVIPRPHIRRHLMECVRVQVLVVEWMELLLMGHIRHCNHRVRVDGWTARYHLSGHRHSPASGDPRQVLGVVRPALPTRHSTRTDLPSDNSNRRDKRGSIDRRRRRPAPPRPMVIDRPDTCRPDVLKEKRTHAEAKAESVLAF
jgi:hypothetical protein